MPSNEEGEEEVTIEDVVECRIILIRRVGNLGVDADACCNIKTATFLDEETIPDLDVFIDPNRRKGMNDSNSEYLRKRVPCHDILTVHSSKDLVRQSGHQSLNVPNGINLKDDGVEDKKCCNDINNDAVSGSPLTACFSGTGDNYSGNGSLQGSKMSGNNKNHNRASSAYHGGNCDLEQPRHGDELNIMECHRYGPVPSNGPSNDMSVPEKCSVQKCQNDDTLNQDKAILDDAWEKLSCHNKKGVNGSLCVETIEESTDRTCQSDAILSQHQSNVDDASKKMPFQNDCHQNDEMLHGGACKCRGRSVEHSTENDATTCQGESSVGDASENLPCLISCHQNDKRTADDNCIIYDVSDGTENDATLNQDQADREDVSERVTCENICHKTDEIDQDDKGSMYVEFVQESIDCEDRTCQNSVTLSDEDQTATREVVSEMGTCRNTCHENDKLQHDGCEHRKKSGKVHDTMGNLRDKLKDELYESCGETVFHHDCTAHNGKSVPDNQLEKASFEQTCQSEKISCGDGVDTESFHEERDDVKNVDFVEFATKQETYESSKSEGVGLGRKDPKEEDYIEILDSSDSDDSKSERGAFTSTAKHQNSRKEDIAIVIDDASCDDSCKKEHISDCDNDDVDDEVVFVGVKMSQKDTNDERKRKLEEEMRRAQEAQDNLERKIRQAREKRAKKVSEMNTSSSKPPPQFTMPNFTFYTGNTTRRKQQNQGKKPHPSTRFNYMEDDAAFLEQERLLRESAARVKAQESIQRMLQMSRGGMQFYREPVQDVSTLPKDHYKWPDPFSRLGVPQRASFDIVKRNYRKLCLLYHPDKARSNSKEAQDRFQAIKEAYETISTSLGM